MRTSEYWRERTLQVEDVLHNRGVEYYHELGSAYDNAAKSTQQDILVLYNRLAKNNDISLTEAKRLLTTRELKEFRWTVDEYIAKAKESGVSGKWVKELENASLRYRISRLEAMKIQMQHHAECVMSKEVDGMTKMLTDLYTDGYYRTAHMVQTGIGVGYSFAELDPRGVEKVVGKPWAPDGRNFSERIWGSHRPALVNDLHKGLTQSIIKGEAPDKLIDTISKKYDVAKSKAGNLVMTESAYFGNAAMQDCYSELDVEEQQFCATLDSHTSDICRAMDGKVFKSNEVVAGETCPPLHCRCRSVMVPYFEDNVTERMARDEETGRSEYVDGDLSYEEWRKKYVKPIEEPVEAPKPKVEPKKTTVEFKPAESIQEAEQFTRSLGVENVSFKKIDINVANDMNRSLTEHFNDFPELKKNIHYWGSAQEKKNFLGDIVRKHYEELYEKYRSVYGNEVIDKRIKNQVTSYFKTSGEWAHAFDHRKDFNNELCSGIAINNKFGGNLELFKQGLIRSVETKFHPIACDTVKSVFDHEFGHQLDYLLDISNNPEFVAIYTKGINGEHVTRETLSKYAVNSMKLVRNKKETIAEAWAEYRNNPNPRPFAKAIGELIIKEYERKFGK